MKRMIAAPLFIRGDDSTTITIGANQPSIVFFGPDHNNLAHEYAEAKFWSARDAAEANPTPLPLHQRAAFYNDLLYAGHDGDGI